MYVPPTERKTDVVLLVTKVKLFPSILVVNFVPFAIVKDVGEPEGVKVKFK